MAYDVAGGHFDRGHAAIRGERRGGGEPPDEASAGQQLCGDHAADAEQTGQGAARGDDGVAEIYVASAMRRSKRRSSASWPAATVRYVPSARSARSARPRCRGAGHGATLRQLPRRSGRGQIRRGTSFTITACYLLISWVRARTMPSRCPVTARSVAIASSISTVRSVCADHAATPTDNASACSPAGRDRSIAAARGEPALPARR